MISILAPTRGRPRQFQEMVETAHDTAEGPVEILGYVDVDDPADYDIPGARIIVGPRIVLSDCWNRLAEEASGDIFQMGSDDIRHRTPGWDRQVEAVFDAYQDRLVFVYTRDGIHDIRLGTHGFVSREWVETLGYFTPDMFPADYADTWLNDIAGQAGRRVYIDSVLIEHLHPIVGKASWDQTHKERLNRREGVDQMWKETQPQRDTDAALLRAVI